MARFLTLIILPAMMMLSYNQVANWHYHTGPLGIPVMHAHPFNKSELPASPFAKHSHTAMEFIIWGQLSQLFTLTLGLLMLIGLFFNLRRKKFLLPYSSSFSNQLFCTLPLLRAPPVNL